MARARRRFDQFIPGDGDRRQVQRLGNRRMSSKPTSGGGASWSRHQRTRPRPTDRSSRTVPLWHAATRPARGVAAVEEPAMSFMTTWASAMARESPARQAAARHRLGPPNTAKPLAGSWPATSSWAGAHSPGEIIGRYAVDEQGIQAGAGDRSPGWRSAGHTRPDFPAIPKSPPPGRPPARALDQFQRPIDPVRIQSLESVGQQLRTKTHALAARG